MMIFSFCIIIKNKMRYKITTSILFILVSLTSFSQEKLITLTIDANLKKNANAVVRLNDVLLEVKSQNQILYTKNRIVTVFNESGNQFVGSAVHYDGNVNIKTLEAVVYNAFGEEIKRIKKKFFEDVSEVPNGTLYSDSRVKYLDYTPVSYPYTVVFKTVVEYKSTAFIPGWSPLEGFYVSTEESKYKIINSSGIDLKMRTNNFDGYNIEELGDNSYLAKNLKAIKSQAYAPAFKSYAPSLKVALTRFVMEGVNGINTDWNDFGKWVNDKLVENRQALPESVKSEVKALVDGVDSDIEKAKLVYQYMQNKTRYISVQVGIGGWKPMLASDVDRLGYGDCKALTNYTKALLEEVGVASYYTLVYGGRRIENIDKTFSKVEGNHAILALPHENDYVWLECTSQTAPFGYNANFTDDRDVLVITPEGGKVVHTKTYNTEENLKTTIAKVEIDENGAISADVKITSEGTQYSYHKNIGGMNEKDKAMYYKEQYFDNINNLEILNMSHENNKDEIVFKEQLELAASKYASVIGENILLAPNMFNKRTVIPPKYKERKLSFTISRGYTDIDEYEVVLAENLEIEALKKAVSIKNKFGLYEVSMDKESENKFKYKRKLIINKGDYKKEDYQEFRAFYLKIAKHDKSKIALKITS